MISTFNSSISYIRQQTELSSFSQDAQRDPQSTANDALVGRLARNVPGLDTTKVSNLVKSEFSPQTIADNISKFVAQGLQNARNEGRSEEEIQSKFEAALKGVKKGFEEAREILSNLDVLKGDIASNIDKSEDLTFKALEELNPANANANAPAIGSTQVQAASVERYSKAESFSLDLKTQDGDTVKILFANQSSQEAQFGYSSDGKGNSSAIFNLTQSQSSAFQFQVQGDLDEGELEAISKLISDVGEISNEFFNGDVQKAFEIATEFKMDKTELASMNLQLTRTQEYTAASSYRSVQNNATPDVGKLTGHLFNNFAQATEKPELGFLKDITKISQQLLDSLVKQDNRFQDASKERQDLFKANLETIREVIDTINNPKETEIAPK